MMNRSLAELCAATSAVLKVFDIMSLCSIIVTSVLKKRLSRDEGKPIREESDIGRGEKEKKKPSGMGIIHI